MERISAYESQRRHVNSYQQKINALRIKNQEQASGDLRLIGNQF